MPEAVQGYLPSLTIHVYLVAWWVMTIVCSKTQYSLRCSDRVIIPVRYSWQFTWKAPVKVWPWQQVYEKYGKFSLNIVPTPKINLFPLESPQKCTCMFFVLRPFIACFSDFSAHRKTLKVMEGHARIKSSIPFFISDRALQPAWGLSSNLFPPSLSSSLFGKSYWLVTDNMKFKSCYEVNGCAIKDGWPWCPSLDRLIWQPKVNF